MNTTKGTVLTKGTIVINKEVVLQDYLESVKDIKSFVDAPKMSKNPFTGQLKSLIKIENKYVNSSKGLGSFDIIDKHTGEVVSQASENRVFTKRQYVDKENFVKLYIDRLKDLYDLSMASIKVFGYFLNEMQKPHNVNRDLIFFNLKDCMEFCDYDTHPMVYKGLTELISHGFIAACSNPVNHFFIDATTAFNGNRILIMEEYIKEEDDYFNGKEIKP
jgi:hypothetical protein